MLDAIADLGLEISAWYSRCLSQERAVEGEACLGGQIFLGLKKVKENSTCKAVYAGFVRDYLAHAIVESLLEEKENCYSEGLMELGWSGDCGDNFNQSSVEQAA